MSGRDIIVIGASAGGVETISRLVSRLTPDLPAAIVVVMHFPEQATSVLPAILSRAGPLRAVAAEEGARLEPGRIYCAPSGVHLLFANEAIQLSAGPRENGHRPAIDPTMRSAAACFGTRVIGVVLSGMLDDGTNGLARIKAHGGLAVVQSPADALFAGMPSSAVANVAVDYVAPLADLPELLTRLTRTPVEERIAMSVSSNGPRDGGEETPETSGQELGPPSEYTCPECHGTLYQAASGTEPLRFRCRVGHAYSAETLVSEQTVSLEAALWTALRSLEEGAALSRDLAGRCDQRKQRLAARRFQARARDLEERAALVRQALQERGVLPDAPDESAGTGTAAIAG